MKLPSSPWVALEFLVPVLLGAALLHHSARANIGTCSPIQDFSKFQLCFGFPAATLPGVDCSQFKFDGNGVVNLKDFALQTFALRVRLSVSPAWAVMTYSQTMDFDTTVIGSGNPSVHWILLPVPGSEPGETLGTIDTNGLYSPPSPFDPHVASQVLVSTGPEGGSACVSLFGTLAGSPPVSLTLPGLGASGGVPANVTIASPSTALVLPGLGDTDALPPNTTVASPPVAVDFENP